jgi:hypothetical protein
MPIKKYFNHDFLGGSPNIPTNVTDRYYGQDRARDFHFMRDQLGHVMKNLVNGKSKIIVSGGIVSQGAGNTIVISDFIGHAPFNVSIPNSWSSLPPSVSSQDIDLVEIIALSIPTFNLDTQSVPPTYGVTPNYIKIAYAETTINSRVRVHGSGSYNCEKVPSYTISCNAVAPTAYEICLGTLTGSSGGSFTITNVNRNFDLLLDQRVTIFSASGTWRKPSFISNVKITIIGAGGGGGKGARVIDNPPGSAGAGGGGAGYIYQAIVNVISDTSIAIGAGGLGGTGIANNGADGGTTSFGTLSVVGGGGGKYFDGASSGGGVGSNSGGQGGVGLATAGTDGGAHGGSFPSPYLGGVHGNSDAYPSGGGGGAGFGGNGGVGGIGGPGTGSGAGLNGGNGIGYGAGGGGGGGGVSGGNGGNGFSGLVIVEWIG